MTILIRRGHIVNPADKMDCVADILIEDGKIKKIGPSLPDEAQEVIDAENCYVIPGLIDMHVHFRDPGFTEKETIESGSKAAVHGGYTTVVAMPNTSPVADNPEIIHYVKQKAAQCGLCNVLQAGAITEGMHGEKLSDLTGMIGEGIFAISEDGKSVMNSELLREAMKVTAKVKIPVLAHCEDKNLVNGGVMNMGEKALRLGLPGISNAVENIIEARDIMLAEETGSRLHLCHCSTKESVELLREAKKKKIEVSGEVCPHHFTLCEDDVVLNDTNFKMNPPLRTKEDREALRIGLRDNVFEVIATDHAPHTQAEKERNFERAPFGIVGLETAAALTYTELVLGGYLTFMQMVEKMSYNPARILGIDRGNMGVGKTADLTIFDPHVKWQIHAKDFAGKGHNMPYENRWVTGKVKYTIYNGKTVFAEK